MMLRSITVSDFRQYRGPHVVDVSVGDTDGRNLVLVVGPNGSGKTTLVQAVRLALFGRHCRDLWTGTTYTRFIRQSLNRVSRSEGVREFAVAVDLDIGDVPGISTTRIERKWQLGPDSQSVSEAVSMYVDGRLLTGTSPEEADAFVAAHIPYGVSEFVFLDGERIQDLAKADFAAADVRGAIETILGLQVYRNLRDHLAMHERELLKSQSNNDELDTAMLMVDTLRQDMADCRAKLASLRGDLAQLEPELDEIHARRRQLGSAKLEERGEMGTSLARLRLKRDLLQQRLAAQVSNELPMVVLLPYLRRLQSKLVNEAQVEQQAAVSALFASKRDELCRELLRIGVLTSRAAFDQTWERVVGTEPARHAIRHTHLTVEAKLALADRLRSEESDVHAAVEELLQGLSQVDTQIRRTQSRIRSLPTDVPSQELEQREQQVLERMQRLYEAVAEAQVEEARLTGQLAVARRREEAGRQSLALQAAARAKLDYEHRLVEALGDFTDTLARRKGADVGRSLAHMFARIINRPDLASALHLNEETFAVTLGNGEGEVDGLGSLSAGEKQIFALSYVWALGNAAATELPIIIDTPVARLDTTHRERVISRFLPAAASQVIVLAADSEVTHSLHKGLEGSIAKEYRLRFDSASRTTMAERRGT